MYSVQLYSIFLPTMMAPSLEIIYPAKGLGLCPEMSYLFAHIWYIRDLQFSISAHFSMCHSPFTCLHLFLMFLLNIIYSAPFLGIIYGLCFDRFSCLSVFLWDDFLVVVTCTSCKCSTFSSWLLWKFYIIFLILTLVFIQLGGNCSYILYFGMIWVKNCIFRSFVDRLSIWFLISYARLSMSRNIWVTNCWSLLDHLQCTSEPIFLHIIWSKSIIIGHFTILFTT